MNSESLLATAPTPPASAPRRSFRTRQAGSGGSLTAHGEPLVWLTGGSLALSLTMILGLLGLVVYQGIDTFWPAPVVQLSTHDGRELMGEVWRHEYYRPDAATLADLPEELQPRARAALAEGAGQLGRRLVRTGNFDLTKTHFHWVDDYLVAEESTAEWAVVIERLEWGRFYGRPAEFLLDGQVVAQTPAQTWDLFSQHHAAARDRWRQRVSLEKHELGAVSRRKNQARLRVKQAELNSGPQSDELRAAERELAAVTDWETEETERILAEIRHLNDENARYQMKMVAADGQEKLLALDEIVRAYPANQLSWSNQAGIYGARWAEFLTADPRHANSEGGVLPAIFGTVAMTIVMSLAVVPCGVLAALYLREYAQAGPLISAIRIAINNLAGVPSIVFGVFGLGFLCYVVGASIDQLFFAAELAENDPTFGTGGVLWASLTLALLTLPVVIVTTEEALAAVPSSMREGSYACGASKWQTIRRIVLPRAMPGIMTGMILAMARGAGEVAPLMLVGAMKMAPELPIDGVFPFVHLERSFMHLGFHIYDLGFQSQNSEAAKPMVFTTTLLLVAIVAALNLAAIFLRNRLRRRFVTSHF
jgi:phosphate transport system permease protein